MTKPRRKGLSKRANIETYITEHGREGAAKSLWFIRPLPEWVDADDLDAFAVELATELGVRGVASLRHHARIMRGISEQESSRLYSKETK